MIKRFSPARLVATALFASLFLVLVGVAFLTPHYADENKALLTTCNGYGSYAYTTDPMPLCPNPSTLPLAPAAPKPEYTYAGTPSLHPVSWATSILQLQHKADDAASLERMRDKLEEFLVHAHTTPQGNLVFPYLFDWPYDYEKSPWYSAMAQGLAGAAFMAGWRILGDERYYDAAIASIEAIRTEGPVYKFYRLTPNGVWLKEYPHNPYTVLDGSLLAIAGIYDVWQALPEQSPYKAPYETLWKASLQGFKDEWQHFKAPYGLYFEDSKRRVTPDYYVINMAALRHLGSIDPEVETIRQKLAMPEGFWPRYFATASGAFFKLTRTWWPHTPIGVPATPQTLPAFSQPIAQ